MSEGSKSRLPFFPFPSTSWVQGRIEWEDFLDVCLSLESTLDRRKTVYCHYTILGGWIHSSSSGNLSIVVVPALSGYFCSLLFSWWTRTDLSVQKIAWKWQVYSIPREGRVVMLWSTDLERKKNYWKMMLQLELGWCEWSTWFVSAKKGFFADLLKSHLLNWPRCY